MMCCSLRSTRLHRAVGVFLLGALPVLGACADAVLAPAGSPSEPPVAHAGRVLGLVEVTLSGLGTGDVHASARPVVPGMPGTTARGLHLALTPVSGGDGTIQLEPLSTGSFTKGVRGSGGERYLYATFQVRNAQVDGTAYPTSRQNLTFLAVSTASTIDETAVSTLQRFDGSPAGPAIATQILPTGQVNQNTSSTIESAGPDVLQVLTEDEVASFTSPAGVTSVFPYGFVVRNPSTSDSRALPANPAAGQFDGVVTFAFKIPLQASAAEDPFTISAMFLALDDDQTRMTQSLEEQDATAEAAFAARATALGATQVTLLPGSDYAGGLPSRLLCAPVRTAGPAGGATATLFPDPPVFVALAPDPYTGAGRILPSPATLAATFDGPVLQADASSFVVTGSQSGRHFLGATYTGVGTATVTTPSAAFFPGELVDVTLTKALGLCGSPRVARYRVAAAGDSAGFTSADIPLGFSASSVAAADLDGDGNVDLAVAKASTGGIVSILRNDGTGTFTSIGTPAVGASPSSVVAADLDGDGDVDLATANHGSSDVTILRNDDDGTATPPSFTSIGTVPVGLNPEAITAADLDGDGDLDLATANQSDDNVSILVNDGTGAFTNAGTVAVGNAPSRIAAADLDQDGDVDLAVGNLAIGTVSILKNDGTGAFAAASTVTLGAVSSLAAADLDGDGDIDLATATASTHTISILANDGTGLLAPDTTLTVGTPGETAQSVTAADLDGDGDLDLAVTESPSVSNEAAVVFIFRNDGTGSFAADATTPGVGVEPRSIIAADLDGDGDLDLAVAYEGLLTVSVLTNGSTP